MRRPGRFPLLNRYEINHESDDYPAASYPYSITAGDVYSLEAGIGKSLRARWSRSEPSAITSNRPPKTAAPRPATISIVFAAGPEISLTFPEASFFASLRYFYEFGAEYRPEGHTVTLTLTKRF